MGTFPSAGDDSAMSDNVAQYGLSSRWAWAVESCQASARVYRRHCRFIGQIEAFLGIILLQGLTSFIFEI